MSSGGVGDDESAAPSSSPATPAGAAFVLCRACKDNPATVRCLPCEHVSMCKVCYVSSGILYCPTCKQFVLDTADVKPVPVDL